MRPGSRPQAPRTAPAAGGAERIARRLQRQHPELSFSKAKHEVESGRVAVDGEVIDDPGAWVEPRSRLVWKRDAPARPRAQARHVEIVHADEDVVVAVKPPGLLTQPTPAREQDTLLSRVSLALARQRPDRRARRFLAAVHRLDRETSGLVAFAVSRRALDALQAQLEAHTMGRVYDAVVEGELAAAAGTFDRALVGDGTHRRRWVAGPDETGKPAVTHWRRLHRYTTLATRVEVRLETGRTHQIRIHFAAAGHPVVGERVYRAPRAPRFPVDFSRLALHAGELTFEHPRDGRRIVVRSPPPADYAALLEKLERQRAPGERRS